MPRSRHGPDINQNTNYFDFTADARGSRHAGQTGRRQRRALGDFKLMLAWSPERVKISSGNAISGQAHPAGQRHAVPFIWAAISPRQARHVRHAARRI